MTPVLHVLDGGAFTTVQDLGRFGAQSLGIPVSGALDPVSLRLANALVGNPHEAAGLEIRMLGPRVRVDVGPVRVALVGTAAPIEILVPDKTIVPAGQTVILQPCTEFRVGPTPDTAACVLAVEGGFGLKPVLGSLSTYTPAGLGGFEGRALKHGDQLALRTVAAPRSEHRLPGEAARDAKTVFRVVLGPQEHRFSPEAVEALLSGSFVLSPASNRMGLRLEGAVLTHSEGHDIASDGVVAGSMQVPGNGQPIVLIADRQTTGGYPKIATVISADVPHLGRLRPGDTMRFEAVSVAQAEEVRREEESWLAKTIEKISTIKPEGEILSRSLLENNLISGVILGE